MVNWSRVKHFKPTENWGDVSKINPVLIYKLDKMRSYANRPFIIHVAYDIEGHAKSSYHGMGMAIDGHFQGMSLLEQYLIAERFIWGGLGLYSWWNNRGLHLDIREQSYGARWASEKEGEYIGLSRDFILQYG